jgi:predicted N-acetyltransferase YhbS
MLQNHTGRHAGPRPDHRLTQCRIGDWADTSLDALRTGSIDSMAVNVRVATAADARAVASLLTQLGYPSTETDVLARLRYWTTTPDSQVLVAADDGRPVGCLSVHAVPYFERTGRWARIESLVVDESSRRTGVGHALLQAAETLSEEWECLAVEVTSSRRRAEAHAFYRRSGYIDICDRSVRF